MMGAKKVDRTVDETAASWAETMVETKVALMAVQWVEKAVELLADSKAALMVGEMAAM